MNVVTYLDVPRLDSPALLFHLRNRVEQIMRKGPALIDGIFRLFRVQKLEKILPTWIVQVFGWEVRVDN